MRFKGDKYIWKDRKRFLCTGGDYITILILEEELIFGGIV